MVKACFFANNVDWSLGKQFHLCEYLSEYFSNKQKLISGDQNIYIFHLTKAYPQSCDIIDQLSNGSHKQHEIVSEMTDTVKMQVWTL